MKDCLFCKIINKEIPAEIVYEGENVIGFKDIAPAAREHYLFIHKNHTASVTEMAQQNATDIAEVFQAITEFTSARELGEDGFRVVTNNGKNSGQIVFHTHFHVLGGQKLGGIC